jgi:hypothetical protein
MVPVLSKMYYVLLHTHPSGTSRIARLRRETAITRKGQNQCERTPRFLGNIAQAFYSVYFIQKGLSNTFITHLVRPYRTRKLLVWTALL